MKKLPQCLRITGICLLLQMVLMPICTSFSQAISKQIIYQLREPSDTLQFENVQKIGIYGWAEVSGVNFGRTTQTGWARVTLPVGSKSEQWLEIAGHFIDSVEVYIVADDRTAHFSAIHYQSLRYNRWSPMRYRYFLYEFSAFTPTQIYIRGKVLPGDVLKFNVRVWEPRYFLAYFQQDIWEWALFAGVVLVAIGTVLINFVFNRRRIFLYYAGYIFSISCYVFLNDGWGVYLPGTLNFLDNTAALGHWLNLGTYCFTWFIRRFLVLSNVEFKKWPSVVIFLLIEFNLVAMHLAQFSPGHMGYTFTGYVVGFIATVANFSLWFIYIRNAIARKFKPVWLLLLAIALMFGFYFTNILFVNLGLLTNPISDMVLFRIAFVTELAVLTIAWLYRQKLVNQERNWLESDNHKLQSDIIEIQDAERQRIAQDLHDELGGNLAAIKMSLQSSGLDSKMTSPLLRLIDEASINTRNIAHNLMPPNFEDVRLIDLLQSHFNRLEQDGHLRFYFHTDSYPVEKFNKQQELTLYRIIMELVSNIISHSGASESTIQLVGYEAHLEVMAEDNGNGFAPAGQKGIGLKSIQLRVKFLNGTLNIDSSGRGTTVVIQIPYL